MWVRITALILKKFFFIKMSHSKSSVLLKLKKNMIMQEVFFADQVRQDLNKSWNNYGVIVEI